MASGLSDATELTEFTAVPVSSNGEYAAGDAAAAPVPLQLETLGDSSSGDDVSDVEGRPVDRPGMVDPLEKRRSSSRRASRASLRRTPSVAEFVPDTYEFMLLPAWMRENRYIHTGYRVHPSWCEIWMSCFSIHNETGNVWSHFLGFVLFTYYLIDTNANVMLHEALQHRLMTSIYIVSAMICLLCSTLYHLVYCHSHDTCVMFARLDYAGISALIVGSMYPVIYYSLECTPHLQRLYLVVISVLGACGMVGPLFSFFHSRSFRLIRTALYFSMGAFGIFPAVHLFFLAKDHVLWFVEARLWIVMLLYAVGALIYAKRYPECAYPGKFDIFFHSHQIWHILIVFAATFHYYTVLATYQASKLPGFC